MLSKEDNERLVRVGPGTPGGEMMRRYWMPALLSSEIPENDGAPVRVRLLGEDLVAFRDTMGRVGLVDAYCPHRRAPMFFGRNEECGLRCLYHGWKFDVTGACVDMPSEPDIKKIPAKVRIKSYPTVEKAGVIWAYLGPKEDMPGEPDFEWLRVPSSHRFVSKTYEGCNYLQAMEGGLDTSHSSFVHNLNIADKTRLRNRDRAPRLDVEPTDYGYCYTSTRNTSDNEQYVRVYQWIMPIHQARGHVTKVPGTDLPIISGHTWVPIDDERTHVFNWVHGYDNSVPLSEDYIQGWESFCGRGEDDLIPGTYRLRKNLSNDYMIDRELQKTTTFSGITGLNTQDFALQEGMGPIVDRSEEHLGTSDKAIIQMRRMLLEATRAVESGERPRGADPETYRHVRPYDSFVKDGADWHEVFAGEIVAKW